jgi:glycosyltransferase involved in cell wall biosynthesis
MSGVQRVCFDLSPRMTSSRLRGIGKNYCLQMTQAFLRAPASLLDGLELSFLIGNGHALHLETLQEVSRHYAAIASSQGPIVSDLVYYALKYTYGTAYLTARRVDLFHGSEPKGTSRPPGAACVMTCHDLIPLVLDMPFDPPVLPARARGLVEWLRYRTVDHVIAISQCTLRDLRRLLSLPPERATLVYQGVDTQFFSSVPVEGEAARASALVGTERPYFIYVGGFDPRKQVPDLVEAFGRVAAGLDQDLVLCGYIRPAERRAIEDRIRRTGCGTRVLMPGFVPSEMLPALYRGATAHTMLSRYEGFGATLLEAMACGCPVIALDASCVPETTGDAALLVQPGSIAAASEALARTARDASLRADLRARGLARAALFSWDRCAAETVAVYRRVLA